MNKHNQNFDIGFDLALEGSDHSQIIELQHIGFNYGVMTLNDAMDLKASAERIKVRLKRTADDIIEIGKELMVAKDKCGHGNFGTWLQSEFEMSDDTAQRFINVAKTFGNNPHSAVFELNAKALYALSAPSTPEEVRTEVLQRVKNGEKVNADEINRLKAENKTIREKLSKATTAKGSAENLLHNAHLKLDEVESEKQRLSTDLQVTKSAFDKLNGNFNKAVEELTEKRLEAKMPELTVQAEAKLADDYQAKIDSQKDKISSLENTIAKIKQTSVSTEQDAAYLADLKQEIDEAQAALKQLSLDEKEANATKRANHAYTGIAKALSSDVHDHIENMNSISCLIDESGNAIPLYPLTDDSKDYLQEVARVLRNSAKFLENLAAYTVDKI